MEWRRAEEAAGGDGELYIVVKECSVERGVTTVMTMGGLEREREKIEKHVKKIGSNQLSIGADHFPYFFSGREVSRSEFCKPPFFGSPSPFSVYCRI